MTNISGVLKSIRDIMWQDTGLNGDAQRIEQLGWMLFLKIFSDKDIELEEISENYKSPIPDELKWITYKPEEGEKGKGNWAGDSEGLTGTELLAFIDNNLFPKLRNIDNNSGNRRAKIVKEVFEGNNNYMKNGTNIRKVLNKLNEIDFNIAKDRHAFGELYETILKELQSAGKSGEFYTPRAITQFIIDILSPHLGEKILDPACGTGGFLTAAIEHIRKNNNEQIDGRELMIETVQGWEYKPLPYLLANTNLILHDIEEPNIELKDVLSKELKDYTHKDKVDVIAANPPFGGIVAEDNLGNFPSFNTKESADLFMVLIIHLLKEGGRAGIVLPDGSLTGDGVKQRVRQKLLEECNLHTIIRLPNSVFQPYATVATNLLFFDKKEPDNEGECATKEIWYYEHRLPENQKSYSKTKPIQLHEFDPIKKWWNNREESEVCWKVNIADIIEKAKKQAQPFWDKAEEAQAKTYSLKTQLQPINEKIKKEGETKELNLQKNTLLEKIAEQEQIAKNNKQTGDSILFAAYDLDIKNPHKQEENHEYNSNELMQMLEDSFAKSSNLLNQLKEALK